MLLSSSAITIAVLPSTGVGVVEASKSAFVPNTPYIVIDFPRLSICACILEVTPVKKLISATVAVCPSIFLTIRQLLVVSTSIVELSISSLRYFASVDVASNFTFSSVDEPPPPLYSRHFPSVVSTSFVELNL